MRRLDFTTYQTGILQAKAYRHLREFMATFLKQYDLTMMEWAIIGSIYDADKKGISISELAAILDVELPLITTMVNRLVKIGLAVKTVDKKDKRVRRIVVPSDKRKNIRQIERSLRAEMSKWLSGINRRDLFAYVKVLESISQTPAK